MKATSMKCNKRVKIVEPSDITFETKCESLKLEILNVYRKWMNENQNIDFSNLNPEELEGLNNVKKKVRDKQLLILHTDKSKKFAIESPESYLESM